MRAGTGLCVLPRLSLSSLVSNPNSCCPGSLLGTEVGDQASLACPVGPTKLDPVWGHAQVLPFPP